jgi:nucleoside phosphorylase
VGLGCCGVWRWVSQDRVDVLIIAALREELEAAKAAGLARSSGGPGIARWEERNAGGSVPFWWGEYRSGEGRVWSLALARPIGMGGRLTAPLATSLVDRLRPSCLAMCGVCAGNPADTALGDVVVAEVAYEWDEGRQSPSDFVGDHRQFSLDPRWLRVAQDFDPVRLATYGAASEDEAMLWLLERLHRGQDPRKHAARGCYFAEGTWGPRLGRWEADGLITRDEDGVVRLTDFGAKLVKRRLYDDVDGPDRLPFRVLAAPMASGSAVVGDGQIWQRPVGMGQRKIAAVEMEAATIATVAWQRNVPRWLVVKGVMDHADIVKDDRYKGFAARASADVLYSLLAKLVPGVQPPVDGPPRAAPPFLADRPDALTETDQSDASDTATVPLARHHQRNTAGLIVAAVIAVIIAVAIPVIIATSIRRGVAAEDKPSPSAPATSSGHTLSHPISLTEVQGEGAKGDWSTGPVTIHGQRYENTLYAGIFCSVSPARVYRLGGKYSRLKGKLGVADYPQSPGEVTFEIYANGQLKMSYLTSVGRAPIAVDLDMTNTDRLEFVMRACSDSMFGVIVEMQLYS